VDFRDQIAVYALFTPSREVVYIGQSGASDQRLFLRLRQHTQNTLRDRWEFFSWFGMRRVNETNRKLSDAQKPDSNCTGSNAEALDEIEAVLLQLFEPRLNKRGPNWGDDTEEYYQYATLHDFCVAFECGSLVNMNLRSSKHEALFMALHRRSSATDAFFSAHAES
jgi:hypothetical protein